MRPRTRTRKYDHEHDENDSLPRGGVRLMVNGAWTGQAEEGTDLRALLDNYVSVGILNNLS